MVKHETTYYEDFTIKTFTEYSNGSITSFENYDKKGKLIYRVVGDLAEQWEYSRGKLRRYSNSKRYWIRYSYKKGMVHVIENGETGIRTYGYIENIIY
jgi:hypothetical protein